MDFKHFDRMIKQSSYDEVKVIGRDVELGGHCAHIIGMTLKDKHAFVYVLELAEIPFLTMREFHSNGKCYEIAGADSCVIDNYNMAEYML